METTFLKDWSNYDQTEKQVKKLIFKGIKKGGYIWQPSHTKKSQRVFNPASFTEVDNLLGLAYTSTGICAGLWCCNGGYLLTNESKHFTGFAINTDFELVAITEDENENETFINFGKIN